MAVNATIIALTESHLTTDILDAEVYMEGFWLTRADRLAGRKKGGVAVYVRSDVAAGVVVLAAGSTGAVEYVVLQDQKMATVLCVVYRPPTCPVDQFLEVLTKIERSILALGPPSPTVMITGDLNMPIINWGDWSVDGGSASSRTQAEALISFGRNHLLDQYVDRPTRGDNILDIFMTNNDELIHRIYVEDTVMSDHRMLIIETNIRLDYVAQRPDIPDDPFRLLNFYHRDVDWAGLDAELAAVEWDVEFEGLTADQMYDRLYHIMLVCCRGNVPRSAAASRFRRIPRDRRTLMRQRTKLCRKLEGLPDGEFKLRCQDNLKIIEQRLLSSHETEARMLEGRAIANIKSNPKYFFKYVKSKATVKAEIGPFSVGLQMISDPIEKCDILRSQYEGAFSRPLYTEEQNTMEVVSASHVPELMSDLEFGPEDFTASIEEMKTASASGPDSIPSLLLKKCSDCLVLPLSMLWSKSLVSGVVPTKLKCGTIVPIYKGGDRSQAKNYRPITLTSHLIKVFERVVVRKLVDYMESRTLFNNTQHGFRRGRSCLSQLIEHYQRIVEALEDGVQTDVVYLDFAKAFDKVDHGVLMRKLRGMGICGHLLAWIRAFLLDRRQVVAVEGVMSRESEVISGVPQGTVLGPLLFLVHISDIDQEIHYASVSSFADDTRLLKVVKNDNDARHMQRDLNSVYEWADTNNMEFNGTKFELLSYVPGQLPIVEGAYVASDDAVIGRKLQVRDLGVTVSSSGRFDLHIESVATKGRRQAGWLLRSFATRERMPMLVLYKAVLLPLMEYCCQLWSPTKLGMIRKLEAIQRTFTSKIAGLEGLNYWERLVELDLYSLERRRERYVVIYVWKIINGLVPNMEDERFRLVTSRSERRGRTCRVPALNNRALAYIQTLKEASFAVRGPRLFNCLPGDLRDAVCTQDTFKRKLDVFLRSVPDRPVLPNYPQVALSNTLPAQMAVLRAGELLW